MYNILVIDPGILQSHLQADEVNRWKSDGCVNKLEKYSGRRSQADQRCPAVWPAITKKRKICSLFLYFVWYPYVRTC
jgi:hypothetical protein